MQAKENESQFCLFARSIPSLAHVVENDRSFPRQTDKLNVLLKWADAESNPIIRADKRSWAKNAHRFWRASRREARIPKPKKISMTTVRKAVDTIFADRDVQAELAAIAESRKIGA